jgi:glutamate dehydrogenase/glutamate dehydrogenase (NAD(P)+)
MEGANGPVTAEADEILYGRGVAVLPDVVANAGSAIVCHYERSQSAMNDYWELEKVQTRLDRQILKSYTAMRDTALGLDTSFRTAAWVNGIKRIVEAMRWRGLL